MIYDENEKTTENGSLMLDFCRKIKVSILNTWFQHKHKHRATWHSPDGVTKNIIDYSITHQCLRKYATDCRVRNSYFHSDHKLLVTKFNTPANKAARWSKPTKNTRKQRHDLSFLNKEPYRTHAFRDAQKCLANVAESKELSIEMQHNLLLSSLTSARKTLPKHGSRKQSRPWESEKLQLLVQQRRSIAGIDSSQKESRKNIHKQIRKEVKHLKNEFMRKEAYVLNAAKQSRQSVQMWRLAKEHGKAIKKKSKAVHCEGLKDHFKSHFNPNHTELDTPREIVQPPEYIIKLRELNTDINNSPPSLEEILDSIKCLKKRKSSIDVEAELLQPISENVSEFQELVCHYYQHIWETGSVPDQWGVTKISAIWKRKGSVKDPSKYRGISIGSLMTKIAMNIILKRISVFYESQLLPTQFGFRSGRGCNDGIYVCKQLQEVSHQSCRKLYTCFVDLSAAYDHINRLFLFQSINNRLPSNTSNVNIEIINSLYNNTKSYLAEDDPAMHTFQTSSGVRQGGNESPVLYNFYSDYALRVWRFRCEQQGLPHLEISFQIPNEATNRQQRSHAPQNGSYCEDEGGYADDIGIHSWDPDDLEMMINILFEVFSEFGLKINISKTETMIWSWNPRLDGPYPASFMKIGDTPIENTKSFKYLGVWMTADDIHIGQQELQYRIDNAKCAFAEHRKLLTNFHLDLHTRVLFLNGLVRSRLTYGCHAWRPTHGEICKIDAAYNHSLRCMVKGGFRRVNPPNQKELEEDENVDWRFCLTNNDIYKITGTTSVTEFFEEQRNNWIGHVIRCPNDHPCKMLTFHNTKNKRCGRKVPSILENVVKLTQLSKSQVLKNCFQKHKT